MSRFLPILLFFVFASGVLGQSAWTEPFPGHCIAGNLYYVGSRDLASYLITTPEGHILINSSLEESPKLIRASVEGLGFKWTDIKVLLISHAHSDHCAGSAEILKDTGAQYCVMAEDADSIENGGAKKARITKGDYTQFPPAKVNRRLKDGDEIKLGGSVLIARRTAGHTPGCTTWTMQVEDNGKKLNAVIIGSPNVNPGYILVGNKTYPGIAADYEETFATLKALPVDLFLGAHGGYYGMEAKHQRLGSTKDNPFVDPAGYLAYVTDREAAFRAEWEKQKAK
ncbi:MAG: subclass B3 metallo-beta-lactamase [Verrucomicrobiaceae bacterium]|nr:subclass B3 metallo-beta-lactamase [Verrucomicrobiaceae bacterium]